MDYYTNSGQPWSSQEEELLKKDGLISQGTLQDLENLTLHYSF